MWCMQRTNIYLEEEQARALDRMAAEEGTSRAAVIRRLLNRALSSTDERLEADLAAIDASFGALADEDFDVVERGPDARSAHLDRMWRL